MLIKAAIKAAIKKGTESGVLVQNGQKWYVSGHEPVVAADEKVGIEDVSPGDGVDCTVGPLEAEQAHQ